MITTYIAQEINFSNDVSDLLCQIDSKVSGTARRKLNSERFGSKVHINKEDYKLLCKYREILYEKGTGSKCLSAFPVEDIISRIKQLLNRN